jgi:hypothetical protein
MNGGLVIKDDYILGKIEPDRNDWQLLEHTDDLESDKKLLTT